MRVRLLGERDADSIAEFIRTAEWDPSATTEAARQMIRDAAEKNPFEPGVAPPRVGVFVGQRLVAYLTSIPASFWNGSQQVPGHWLKGFWVLPDYRNGPIGFLLLKEMLRNVGLAASMPAALVPRQLSVALGMRDLGAVSNYIQPLRMSRILAKLDLSLAALNGLPAAVTAALRAVKLTPIRQSIGALVNSYIAAASCSSALVGRRLRSEWSKSLPEHTVLDDLWSRARGAGTCGGTRSGAYLRWRYPADAASQYSFATVWQDRRLAALVTLAAPQRLDDSRLQGLAIGSVVDLVFDPNIPHALAKALARARRWGRAQGYDALLFTASHHSLRGALRGAGYFRTPGNIHLLVRDKGGQSGLSPDLGQWSVTRGDAWSDHL